MTASSSDPHGCPSARKARHRVEWQDAMLSIIALTMPDAQCMACCAHDARWVRPQNTRARKTRNTTMLCQAGPVAWSCPSGAKKMSCQAVILAAAASNNSANSCGPSRAQKPILLSPNLTKINHHYNRRCTDTSGSTSIYSTHLRRSAQAGCGSQPLYRPACLSVADSLPHAQAAFMSCQLPQTCRSAAAWLVYRQSTSSQHC